MSAAPRAVTRPGALAASLALLAGLLALAAASWPDRAANAAAAGHPIAYTYDVSPISATGATTTVYAIDTVTGAQVAHITVPNVAGGIAVTPDAKLALVPAGSFAATAAFRRFPGQLASGGTLNAISTATNAIVATAPVGDNPIGIAVAPDGSTAYVVNGQSVSPGSISPVTIGPGPSLTEKPSINLPTSAPPVADAVTPDGSTLLVLAQDSVLYTFSLPAGTQAGQVSVGGAIQSNSAIAISPDGTTAYLAASGPNGGVVLPVALKPTLSVGSTIFLGPGITPGAVTIATTPAGKSTLFVGDSLGNAVQSIALGTSPPALTTLPVSAVIRSLFATPDGGTVEMTTAGDVTVPLTGSGTPPGTVGGCLAAQSCPPGAGQIAITPDQAPVARFAATPGPPGKPTSFDASPSTVAYGAITRYVWDFGDGSPPQTTFLPTTPHTYSQAGQYSVVLTETDSAGTTVASTPPSQIFTGQTMTRHGSVSARVTQRITVSTTTIPTSTASPTPTTTASPLPSPPPGFSPKITLAPAVGPPGTVVSVDGAGFPPASALVLVWSPGIGRTAVTTDAHGAFTARQVLVFPKDQLGARKLTADPFPGATAGFLVVPPPLAPGGAEQLLPQLVYRG